MIALNVPTWETSLSYAGEADFYRGLAALDDRDSAAAARRFATATEDESRTMRGRGSSSRTSLGATRPIAAWTRAAATIRGTRGPSRRLAQRSSRPATSTGATAVLEASITAHARDDAHYAPDHLNLAFMQARLGKVDRAPSPTSPPRAAPIPATSRATAAAHGAGRARRPGDEPGLPRRARRRCAMKQRLQRAFIVAWIALALAGALDHTIAQHLLGRTIDSACRTCSTAT